MLNIATIMENEFEDELKDYLTFLAWASKEMEDIYNEEVNNEINN